MKTYNVKLSLLTDTLLGSGESVPGIIDNDIKYDEVGLPYMDAKTWKGHVGEQIRLLTRLQDDFRSISVDRLLGSADLDGDNKSGKLFFSSVSMEEDLAEYFKSLILQGEIGMEEFIDNITSTYSYTSLDDEGIAKDHTLRRVRMINKGLVFHTKIYGDNLTELEEQLLFKAVRAVQHIGTYKSKGKGLVRCEIS